MNNVNVRQRKAVCICISLLLFGITGCEPSTNSSRMVEQDQKNFANKELNVAVFEGGNGRDYWNAVKLKFEKDYPGVKINLTSSPKIMDMQKPQIVAGRPPDFIYMPPGDDTGTIEAMLKDKQLLDLTDVFEGKALDNDEPLKNKLLGGALDWAKQLGDGKIYYAPAYVSTLGLFYNKALFENKGWKVPKTWDEFMTLGEAAKREGRSLFTYQGTGPGYNEAVFWPAVAAAGGMEAVTRAENYEPGAFQSEAVKKAMNIFQTISQKDYLMKGTVALNHTQAQTAFLLGKALFIPCGNWIENEMKDAPREDGFQFGFLTPPVFKEGDQQYAYIRLDAMYIPAKARNIELAKQFLRYQYNDEIVKLNAMKSKGIMAVKNGAEIAKPYISPVFFDSAKILDHGVKPILFQWKTTPKTEIVMSSELYEPIGSIMNKSMTVQQWSDNAETVSAKLRELIDKSGK